MFFDCMKESVSLLFKREPQKYDPNKSNTLKAAIMKKIVLHLAGILLIALISAGNAHSADSELIGSWEFSASSAPWEYNKGTLIFEVNDEETLDGKVVFH